MYNSEKFEAKILTIDLQLNEGDTGTTEVFSQLSSKFETKTYSI
jgi:hypothetical protein